MNIPRPRVPLQAANPWSIPRRAGKLASIAPARARGLTLIEVLVVVVLLAIGLLGLAGLQLRGLQVNQGSQLRSQAAMMAEDMADRMRADPTDAANFGAAPGFYGVYTASTLNRFAPVADWYATFAKLPGGTLAGAALPAGCGAALPCVQVQAITGGPTTPTPIQIAIYWNDAHATVAQGGAAVPTAAELGSYVLLTELSNSF
jgi:prepilin-type N-terminal cleavage/methylation domain-containing protein